VEMLGEHRAELMAVPAVCLDRETALKVKALGVEGLWPGEGAWLQQLSQCCQGQAPGEEAATVTAS
ncbi:MAG TPA: hypothetical protein VD902_18965, partial [Symbiobacteriaceae bacterium]|nr:hypothetical protein [Symbiobacteriaceae bacterium]